MIAGVAGGAPSAEVAAAIAAAVAFEAGTGGSGEGPDPANLRLRVRAVGAAEVAGAVNGLPPVWALAGRLEQMRRRGRA